MQKEVEPNLENNLKILQEQLQYIKKDEYMKYVDELNQIIEEINIKEVKLNELINERNELQELENQLRHIKKKSEAYNLKVYEEVINAKYGKYSSESIKRRIKVLSEILVLLDQNEKIGIWNNLKSIFILKKQPRNLETEGIIMYLLLEDYYLTNLIEEKRKTFERQNFEELKEQIKELYNEKYIPISKKILEQIIKNNIDVKLMKEIFDKVDNLRDVEKTEDNPTPIVSSTKNDLLKLYPIVLTTVDSVISNYWTYFYNGEKVDYAIIDESSQCDILSALPLLYIAKKIIIVGDEKQLSAITNIDKDKVTNIVNDEYNYSKENFLSSIIKTINPVSKMLLEHYRCDYNIINYCNKFFYDNKLKIYNDGKKEAMILINDDKGKYVDTSKGYENQREIKTIEEQIEKNITGRFIITPFRRQADVLRDKYGKARCGTIHTFQGKGEKEVYFSTVLNNTEECINHLNGENNLFTNELLNVAVSRAKEKFVLVSDVKFFKKYDVNMKNLIEYIEVYGNKIPDKTVCIFDYLYREIPTYQGLIKNIDNPFEEKVYYLLKDYIKDKKYKLTCKLPLAEFVTDRKYLDENEELKKFILSNSHIDFSLYTESINKPVLAIEVDGKSHDSEEQITRDEKKEQILKYMDIPLLRVRSKVAWDEEEFVSKIDEILNNKPVENKRQIIYNVENK